MRIEKAISDHPGFELKMNDWVTARREIDDEQEPFIYHSGYAVEHPEKAEEASVIVTVAEAV